MKDICNVAISIILWAFLVSQSDGKDWFSSAVEINIRVIDERANPVARAEVEGYLWSPYTHDALGDVFNLLTDNDGQCTVRGTGYHSIVGVVRKDGHYQTEFDISLGDKSDAREQGNWSLQDAVVTLKEVRNPIPMYAKRVAIDIPEQNQRIGFDMERGDWVAPYGRGRVSDFDVNYSTQQEAVHQYEKQMTFNVPTPHGGFVISRLDEFSSFASDYDALTDGYEADYSFEQKRTPEQVRIRRGYLDHEYLSVRSRVETNHTGEIVSANYSKIYGPIEFALWRNQKYLQFTYYYNPTPNDRNLEFDPKQNLFTDLKSSEQVRDP